MPHEPIELEDGWEHSRKLVEYEINRNSANIHDLRGDVHRAELDYVAERKAESAEISRRLNANDLRVAVLEAKVILYGVVSGAVGMAVMAWFLKRF